MLCGMTKKPKVPMPLFRTGQIWEVEGTTVQIGLVGKTLVHFKRYKNKRAGVPTSLKAKTELESYLRQNKATLIQE